MMPKNLLQPQQGILPLGCLLQASRDQQVPGGPSRRRRLHQKGIRVCGGPQCFRRVDITQQGLFQRKEHAEPAKSGRVGRIEGLHATTLGQLVGLEQGLPGDRQSTKGTIRPGCRPAEQPHPR